MDDEEENMTQDIDLILLRDAGEKEFRQAVENLLHSLAPVLENNPRYRNEGVIERLIEPERIITFRIPWTDDQGRIRINRGYRVQMSSVLGPYKGGLRFHPSVSQSIIKFLAFEQIFTNALTTMPLGAAAGGTDFDPKGKSDNEVMGFCQSFMRELYRHIGADTDVLSSDIGVGAREIGYLFGMYRKLTNAFTGVITGKGLGWGGSLLRPQAAGYGCVYFAGEMLARSGLCLKGMRCLVSGSGNLAQAIAEKLLDQGAKVLTLSDSGGYIHDAAGVDAEKLAFVKQLKNLRRGSLEAYARQYPHAEYIPIDPRLPYNPIWNHKADCVFPAATEYEINLHDGFNLINNHIKLLCEGSNMPCTAEAMALLTDKKNILYGPAKAVNAGGVAVAGLEMAQNNMRLSWSREEVDNRLKLIMHNIHRTCLEAAEQFGQPGNYVDGANIAGFIRVAEAMIDQGTV
jgi:glutamate dehydrogenase (NADP+)